MKKFKRKKFKGKRKPKSEAAIKKEMKSIAKQAGKPYKSKRKFKAKKIKL